MARCTKCGGPYRSDGSIVDDPLYRGPVGHAPPDICAECWESDKRAIRSGQWRKKIRAMQFIADGCTQVETAKLMRVCERTIRNWKKELKTSKLDCRKRASCSPL